MVRIRITLSIVALLAISSLPARSGAEPRGAAPAAPGQSSAPDSYGYKWIDNAGADDPASGGAGPSYSDLFQDISSTGAVISGNSCDDCINAIAPQMMVRYYGQNWGVAPAGSGAQVVSPSIYVSTNGNIQFLASGQSPNASYSNVGLPAGGMNGMVAHMWDDGYGASAGNSNVWQVVGSAPNRRLLIQYNNWDWCCSDGPNLQMQIQFTESDGVADSTIYIIYSDITNSDGRECGNNATIGIQSPTQNAYLQYSLNQASIVDNRVIKFSTNQPPAVPATLTQATSPGGPGLAAGTLAGDTLYFRATLSDPDASNKVGLEVESLPAGSPFQTGITGTAVQTAPAAMVSPGGVSELTMAGFGDGSFHWRARAFDDRGASSGWVEFSVGAASFHVDGTPPSAPAGPLAPSGVQGSPTSVRSVGFSWGPSTDSGPVAPLTYRVEVSTTPSFATLEFSGDTQTLSFSGTFSVDTDYYWRVSAVDSAGNQGAWAGPTGFKLELESGPEEPPEDILPCAAGVATPRWTPLAGLLIAAVLLIRRRPRV
jgi:hypothetical protein